MALSPEDVIKKSFSATHLRRGYDETQVDDFLDEVVVELRRLLAEQEELATQLEDCRSGQYDGGLAGGDTVLTGDTGVRDEQVEQARREREHLAAEIERLTAERDGRRAEAEEVEADAQRRIEAARLKASEVESQANEELEGRLQGELLELQQKVESTRGEAEAAQTRLAELRQQVSQAEQAARATVVPGADPVDPGTAAVGVAADAGAVRGPAEDPTTIIELAQRLHDQHVAEGQETRQRLISEGDEYRSRVVSEGDEYRERVVSEADTTAQSLVREGQEKHDELVATGQAEHDKLVNEGQARHEELISTGQAEHDRVVAAASQQRDSLISEAETKRANILTDLEVKQAALTGRIEELKTFESDYRTTLRGYLVDQMSFLDRDGDGVDDRSQ